MRKGNTVGDEVVMDYEKRGGEKALGKGIATVASAGGTLGDVNRHKINLSEHLQNLIDIDDWSVTDYVVSGRLWYPKASDF